MSQPLTSAPDASALRGLALLRLRLDLEARDDLALPSFSGTSFRGLLGWCLQAAACPNRPPCRECRQPDSCAYSYLFETRAKGISEKQGSEEVPRPFVLEPPFGLRTICSGEPFRLGLTLFGRATEYLPHFLYAVEEMGRRGLGERQARFTLKSASVVRPGAPPRLFYEGGNATTPGRALEEPSSWDLSEMARQADGLTGARRLEIAFQTPTRLVSRGQLVDEPEFHHLIRALLRRIDLLGRVHGEGPLDVDFRQIVARAEECALEDFELDWFDFRRHSNRQRREIQMGGLVGRAIYAGPVGEFLPLLMAGQELHLGKATTFGLGRIEVRILPGGATSM
ncbi:MAG: CRISPR system precrRNA processing endoribonuclease RAMP protein Cas6 [Candidatus Xenobium sp.]|jgi:hypothetical protein|nr:CRISPR system precrRNA processing endoribonuclease RAMP protein Cas6 [Burkholderiales bacterium]